MSRTKSKPATRATAPTPGDPTHTPSGTPPRFRHLIPSDVNFDFVGKRKFFLILSTALNLLTVVLFFTRGFNLGTDFLGGTSIHMKFAQPTTAADLRKELTSVDLPDLTVQDFGEQGKEFLLRFELSKNGDMTEDRQRVISALTTAHPGDNSFEVLSVDSVGPRVGAELRQRAFLAVACTTLLMGIYIGFRFEPSFGAGAVIALFHDVMIAAGALMLTRMFFDLTTLAAMLTVIGFSVHDTIIVSDRIREHLHGRPKASLATVINESINETLSRTILTTGTAILVLLALFVFGGKTLQPFAFTLIVGFITGTYSSIYIAAPVVLFWSGRSEMSKRAA